MPNATPRRQTTSKGCDAVQIYASNGDSEVPDFFEGARSRDLVEPLTKEELPPFNTWKWLTWSVPPPYRLVIFTCCVPTKAIHATAERSQACVTHTSHALPVRITQSARGSLLTDNSGLAAPDFGAWPAGLSRCITLTHRWGSVTTACPLQACWRAAGCW